MTLPTSSSERIGRLFRYWTALRSRGGVPGIAAFDPLQVADLMPNLWMAGWKEDVGDFVYRVAGDAILTTNGRPMHRRSLHEIYPECLAANLRDRFTRICAERCIYHSTGTVYIRIGRYGVGERLILPFLDRDGSGPVVLGCTDYRVISSADRSGTVPGEDDVEIRRFLTLDGDPIASEVAKVTSGSF
ncbi:PAS domain-containing protein [Thalassobaculum litoreum]|uniref:PAS domain-containing protein n=1 Tax=Thalassobaculum litoreum DSM 18839 TaxID=1123362 RepID=A0A8G2BDY5_9PROT|nr:PAS domain-containing protein [Thalassobaculum litoreum]SDF06123.1 PAS domain-containing protein [Thalassobaculum litoreum DSM 18839]